MMKIIICMTAAMIIALIINSYLVPLIIKDEVIRISINMIIGMVLGCIGMMIALEWIEKNKKKQL